MPAIGFICPDEGTVLFAQCLKECRCGQRCAHISILQQAAKVRPWQGVPSITQLQKATCESYLEIVHDYFIRPEDRTFAIFGTAVHSILESDLARIESKLGFTGLPDDYADETITDFKVSTIYVKQETIDKWIMQVNGYKLLLEEAGHKVSKLQIQLIARDAKKTRGQKTLHWIECPILDPDHVKAYFSEKASALKSFLASGSTPPKCTQEENWNGIKCKFYCDVAKTCPYQIHV
jgi:hypothetical protein